IDLLRSVAISFLHFRLGSTPKLCLGVSWVVFVSVSDHEVRKQPIQPRGWTGLLRTARFSSYVAAWQTRELYNVTLAEYSRRVQSKEFIATIRPVNRCSLLPRRGDLGGSSTRDFSSTSNLNPLTSRIPLLFPRIAVRVIAVSFPETKLVVIQQQEPAHPLHALPRIQMRHD